MTGLLPFFGRDLTVRQIVTRRLIPGLVLVGVAVPLSVMALGSTPEAVSAAVISERPVVSVLPEPVDHFVSTRGFTGRIDAERSVDLGFQLAGELAQVEVKDGQVVAKGALLARLDTRRLVIRQGRLEAQLAGAQARLDEMLAGPRKQTIAAAAARLNELDEQLALMRLKQTRRSALRASDVISQEELDEARAQSRAQAARLESARRELELLEAGTRDEQLRAQRAVVEQFKEELKLVGVELDDSRLLAPFAGTVGQVRSDAGTVVAAGAPVMRLVETGVLEAWVGVPARAAGRLEVGSQHDLQTRSGTARATIRALLPELDPSTRTTTVIMTVNDPASGLVPGQVVHVRLSESTPVVDGSWLPLTALDRGERDLWSVFALVTSDDGLTRVERRDVEVLHVDTDRALVRGGLRPGETVVATGVHRLVPGEAVVVQAEQRTGVK